MPEEHTSKQEHDLVERLQGRDPQAMMELYDQYGRLLYSIIFRAVNDTGIAEDLTQETLLRVWNRIGTFQGEKGSLQPWLVTIARNQAFDYLRSVRRNPALSSTSLEDLEQAGAFYTPEDQLERVASQKAVKQALESLKEDQREVIELTHFEGLSQTEIAERLRKPLGTVKGLVRSALKHLRAATTGAGVP